MKWPSRVSCSTQLIALPLLVVLGCGGGDTPSAPETTLTVTVQTEGIQADADGYSVQAGSQSGALVSNGSVTIHGLQTGTQTVTLTGIAPNCGVTGSNPVTVQIQSGQTAVTAFHVVCTATPGGSLRIALMTNHDPNFALDAYEISSMNSDGSIVPLTSNSFANLYPVWSPDGQKIVFASDRDGPLNIYVMNQDGSNTVRLTTTAAPNGDRFAAWSPDGARIVFESNRTGSTEIYSMNADGSNVVRLTNNAAGDNAPHFSPDGTRIVFVTNRDAPDPNPPYGKWEVYVMNSDGSSQTRLTTDAALAELPSFFSNNRILFDSNRVGFNNIYAVNGDGTSETQLTNNAFTTFLAVASPDQTRVMVTVSGSNHSEVYTVNPDGTNPTPLTRQQDGVLNIGYSYRK